MLAAAISAYRSHDLARAEAQAKLVSNYDPKLSGQVKQLLDLIHNQGGQAQAQALLQVQAAWNKGDFDSVISVAQTITAADSKAAAGQYVSNVNTYRGYMNQAQSLEASNPQGAIQQLTLAKNLNPNGPGNPAGRIAQLQQAMQAKTAPPPPTPTKQPANSGADLAKKVNKLLSDAREAEKQGKPQDALAAYAEVLKLQPENPEAQSSTERIQQAVKSDPAAAKSELKAAIRYFYNSQFDDARRALMSYLESPQTATDPGVADFYLGATLVERSILQTPRAQWQGPSKDALLAFQQARKANYSPMRSYVSPMLLKIWDSTAQ
jgi:tetratricopeptide (TPR) repeat protein